MVSLDPVQFDYELARRDLRAQDLARLSGVHEVTISRLRRGRQRPTVRTLRRLVDALADVPVRRDLDRILQTKRSAAARPSAALEEGRTSALNSEE